jgi:ABC-type multidrug transport system ATPase subunit
MTTPVIKADKLTKRYGNHAAVDGVDVQVRAGECWGLLGQMAPARLRFCAC